MAFAGSPISTPGFIGVYPETSNSIDQKEFASSGYTEIHKSDFSKFYPETGTGTTQIIGCSVHQKIRPVSAILESLPDHEAILAGLTRSFDEMTQSCPEDSTQAATACVVVFNPKTNILYIASVGDCGAAVIYRNSETGRAFNYEEFPDFRDCLLDPHERIQKDLEAFGRSGVTRYLTHYKNYKNKISACPNIEWHILPKADGKFDIDLFMFSKAFFDNIKDKNKRFQLLKANNNKTSFKDKSFDLVRKIFSSVHSKDSPWGAENIAVSCMSLTSPEFCNTARLWAIFENIGLETPIMADYLDQNFVPHLTRCLSNSPIPRVLIGVGVIEELKAGGESKAKPEEKVSVVINANNRLHSYSYVDYNLRNTSAFVKCYPYIIAEFLSDIYGLTLIHNGSKTNVTQRKETFITSKVTDYNVCGFVDGRYPPKFKAQLEVITVYSSIGIKTHVCFTLDRAVREALNYKEPHKPLLKEREKWAEIKRVSDEKDHRLKYEKWFGYRKIATDDFCRYELAHIACLRLQAIYCQQHGLAQLKETHSDKEIWCALLSSKQRDEVLQFASNAMRSVSLKSRPRTLLLSSPQRSLNNIWREHPTNFLHLFSFIEYAGFFRELSYFPEFHVLHETLRDYRLNCFRYSPAARLEQIQKIVNFMLMIEKVKFNQDDPFTQINIFEMKDGRKMKEEWDLLLQQLINEMIFLEFIVPCLPKNDLIPKILNNNGIDIGPYYTKLQSMIATIFCCPCRCDYFYTRYNDATELCGPFISESLSLQVTEPLKENLQNSEEKAFIIS